MNSLPEKYKKEVIPRMREIFGYRNDMAVPRIEKVTVNIGFGRMIMGKTGEEQKKIHEEIFRDLALITGQKPVLTFAKKSIASFKIRQGLPIGAKVTLRGKKMYDFLGRVIHIVLPRSRDFRGIPSSSCDAWGNLTVGIREHIAFPEVSPERAKTIFGLEMTVSTNARAQDRGIELFKLLGFPIK